MSSEQLAPRIIGTEMEYPTYNAIVDGVTVTEDMLKDRQVAVNQDILTHLPAQLPRLGQNTKIKSQFYKNGMRLYPDVGGQFEMATAECLSIADVVHSELATERILIIAAENARADREARGIPFDRTKHFHLPYVRRRVIDDFGKSWGAHASFYCERKTFENLKDDHPLRPLVLAHLATMSVFAGAGQARVLNSGRVTFRPAQKIHSIGEECGQGTTNEQKALLNLRDESHAEDDRSARLHLIPLDATINPGVTFNKLGSVLLVLRLGELGVKDIDDVALRYPLKAAKLCGSDSTLRQRVELLHDNKMVRPLDVQDALITKLEKLVAKEQLWLPDEELVVLERWRRVIDLLKRNPLDAGMYVEWVARKHFIEKALQSDAQKAYRASKGLSLRQHVRMLETRWDCIDPTINVGRKHMQVDGRYPAFPEYDPERVEYLIGNPPEDTRAYARGHIIGAACMGTSFRNGRLKKAYWNGLEFDSASYKINDPYNPRGSSEIHEFLAEINL